MTEKVNPSQQRPIEAFKTAGAIAYGGQGNGFVSPSASPTDISVQDSGINDAGLNAFQETSSATSFDVTIDGGEAFVFGSWLAIDTDTTVALASSTAGQTVYVGWNKNANNDVIIGLSSAFATTSGDTDEKIPLWTFDTDGSGVTNVVDERKVGRSPIVETDLEIPDDTPTLYGDDGDFSIEYNSTSDELEVVDEINDTIKQTFDKNGDVHIPNGALNFRNDNSITASGTESIAFDGAGRVDVPNGDLRIAEGQAIEDGSGQERYKMQSTSTQVHSEAGVLPRISVSTNDSRLDFQSASSGDIRFVDNNGSFTAVKYTTSSSAPGTLELTKAAFDVRGEGTNFIRRAGFPTLQFVDTATNHSGWQIQGSRQDDVFQIRDKDTAKSVIKINQGGNVRINPDGSVLEIPNSSIRLYDQSVNPSFDGELVNNGGDVIVQTGGSDLNLSNVGTSSYGDEDAQDAVGNIMTGSGATSVNYDDASNTITISSTTSSYGDEDAQDAVGTIMTGSGSANITYDDANDTIDIYADNDNDTTYSGGNAITLSGTTFNLNENHNFNWGGSQTFTSNGSYVFEDNTPLQFGEGTNKASFRWSNSPVNKFILNHDGAGQVFEVLTERTRWTHPISMDESGGPSIPVYFETNAGSDAQIYGDSSGEVVAEDNSGNSTTLT